MIFVPSGESGRHDEFHHVTGVHIEAPNVVLWNDEQLSGEIVGMGEVDSHFVSLSDEIQVLFGHKSQLFEVGMEIYPDYHGMIELLLLSGKG